MASHSPSGTTALPAEQLDELVRRLVEALHPLRIYLFGSHARGTARGESDVDVMIVVEDTRRLGVQGLRQAHRALRGLNLAIELHWRSRESFDRRRAVAGTLEHEVHTRGHLLYAA